MHLVFVNGRFPQLSQTFVLKHIDSALDGGDEVTVTATFLEAGVRHPLIEKRDLYKRLKYSRPIDGRLLVRLLAALCRNPFRYIRATALLCMRRLTFNEFACAMQLERPPDILIANFGPNGILAAKLKQLFFPDARLAVVFHGNDVSAYIARHGWDRYRRIAPLIDLAVAVNGKWAELLVRQAGMQQVIVHHLGVAVNEAPRRRANDEFAILFVGRMIEKKGFEHLLRAARELKQAGKAFRLHAVGDGPLFDRCAGLMKALGLDDRVVMHGACAHDFVLQLMRRCDCLAAPSVTAADGDAEGIPVTLMEAMASGLPVISTRHSGIPELVADGKSGLLTDEGDVEGLFRALLRLMEDAPLRQRLGEAGHATVRQNFNAAIQDPLLFERIKGAGDRPSRGVRRAPSEKFRNSAG